eukprot:1146919-Pyramimonas_sp.AAC.1
MVLAQDRQGWLAVHPPAHAAQGLRVTGAALPRWLQPSLETAEDRLLPVVLGCIRALLRQACHPATLRP